MPVLRVSAKIINWPPRCACCCGPSDTSIPVGFTRTKGVRVIKHESKSWQVPYCRHCLQHLQAEEALAKAREEAASWAQAWKPVHKRATGDAAVFLILLVLGSAMLFVGAPWVLMVRNINPVLAAFLATVVGGPFAGGVAWLCWKWHLSLREKQERRQKQLDAEYQVALEHFRRDQDAAEQNARDAYHRHQKMLRPGCPSTGVAVVYDGWQGTVHTFDFANSQFATVFAQANDGKMMHGQMG